MDSNLESKLYNEDAVNYDDDDGNGDCHKGFLFLS